MSEQDGPPRWQSDAGVPAELKRALRVLRRQDQSSARLDRVVTRLGPLADAAPPVDSRADALLRQARGKLLATRLALAALAVGSTVIWLAQTSPVPAAGTPAQIIESALLEPAPDPVQGPARAESPAEVAEVIPTIRSQRGVVRRSFSVPRTRRISSVAIAERVRTVKPNPKESVTTPVVDETIRTATAPARAPNAEPQLALPPPRSEVELLFDAQSKKKSDPHAALLLLDEHRARFADGLLAQEREVLAIQVLRELGQTSAAEQRLRAYRASYPHSMHLPRLDRTE